MIEIASGRLTAVVNPLGAELSSLEDSAGRELMTDADPAFWTGRAPLLFPIVGALNGDRYRMGGREYSLPKHGFARRETFAVLEAAPERAVLRLTDNDATRAAYPFAFALEASFTLTGPTLTMAITVANRGETDMPASFGFHPAFAWPLPYGENKEAHRLLFAQQEGETLIGLTDTGLTSSEGRPTPVRDRMLALRDDLFAADALIWQPVRSQMLQYGAATGPQLVCEFPDTPALGVWTKPGARYLCIEPWHGIADPDGFTGEIWDKPLIERISPGDARTFAMRVTLRD